LVCFGDLLNIQIIGIFLISFFVLLEPQITLSFGKLV